MTRRQGMLKTLSMILPAGALGASVALALSAPAQSRTVQTSTEPDSAKSVSTRLQSIRAGVSVIEASAGAGTGTEGAGVTLPGAFADDDTEHARVAWWGNGGFGRFRFGWGNGGWGWHNGGWGNGGWGNGWRGPGWGNGWGNGWHNGGGWRNFWHNG